MGFDLQGHRGCRGLRPENTLAGFRHALALGVSGVEIDIAVTADGVPVVHHDPALNPAITRGPDHEWLENPSQPIRTMRLDELAGFDVGRIRPGTKYAADYPDQVPVDGAHIPTFAQVAALIAAAGQPITLNIELKTFPDRPELTVEPAAMAASVVSELDRHGLAGQTLMQSFDWRALDWVRTHRPEIDRSYLTERATCCATWLGGRDPAGRPAWQVVKQAGGNSWSPQFCTLSAETVAAAREAGLRVLAWTVNEAADMHRLIDWGVTGIISDRPDRLRQVLAERKMPLPPAAG